MKILQGVLVVALSLAGLANGEDDGDLRQEQSNYRTANPSAPPPLGVKMGQIGYTVILSD